MEPLAWVYERMRVFLSERPFAFVFLCFSKARWIEPLVWGECEGAPFCETSPALSLFVFRRGKMRYLLPRVSLFSKGKVRFV